MAANTFTVSALDTGKGPKSGEALLNHLFGPDSSEGRNTLHNVCIQVHHKYT